ncbi:DUF2147 domain-containing protein [Lichenihabitans sp. PAMC28606]|uniref:DUF2147 domain-containing protein n=1 Tax=Lichenihabitans sp. PAMC28606 TaxID=2880932 RepID=UPI001D0BD6AA|nr:DUF2147 domain-containing protein [Lichenihabitans sp. PAMC28606]UDL94128.1 DUF2147 domain-containing protein [Lichenihabitans sp. PAMC28606]
MNIRKCLVALAAGYLMTLAPAYAAPKSVIGTWLTEDDAGRIRIELCKPGSDTICGFVVWMKSIKDDDGKIRLDEKNPDTKKRSRQLLGHELILSLKPNEDDRYAGKIYDADNGKSYDVTLWAEEPNEVRVKGCFLHYLCGSQTWKRVTDLAPGQLIGATGQPNGPRRDTE